MHVSALGYMSLGKELTVDEKVDFAHSVVGLAMYFTPAVATQAQARGLR